MQGEEKISFTLQVSKREEGKGCKEPGNGEL